MKAKYNDLKDMIISSIPVETDRKFNHEETLKILELFFLDFTSQERKLKIQERKIHELEENMRVNATFEKYYPTSSEGIIKENSFSKKSSISSSSLLKETVSKSQKELLQYIVKARENGKNSAGIKELQTDRMTISHEEDSINHMVQESTNLVERNCENLLGFLNKNNEENDDLLEYCKHILELVKSEFDYLGIRLEQVSKKNREFKEVLVVTKAKARKYKNRCRVLEKEIGIMMENERRELEKTQLDEENGSYGVVFFLLFFRNLKCKN